MIFPDFSSLFKIPWLFPDWKMPSHFSRFSSPSGNPERIQINVHIEQQQSSKKNSFLSSLPFSINEPLRPSQLQGVTKTNDTYEISSVTMRENAAELTRLNFARYCGGSTDDWPRSGNSTIALVTKTFTSRICMLYACLQRTNESVRNIR